MMPKAYGETCKDVPPMCANNKYKGSGTMNMLRFWYMRGTFNALLILTSRYMATDEAKTRNPASIQFI